MLLMPPTELRSVAAIFVTSLNLNPCHKRAPFMEEHDIPLVILALAKLEDFAKRYPFFLDAPSMKICDL